MLYIYIYIFFIINIYMDSNIINYLTQQDTNRKTKSTKQPRRKLRKPIRKKFTWGSKIGGKGARDYSRKGQTQNNPIDRLLTLMATTIMSNQQSPADISRLQQLQNDRGIARTLQQEEILKDKSKDKNVNRNPTDYEREVINTKYRGYGEKFDSIEDQFIQLREELLPIADISVELASDIRKKILKLSEEKFDLKTSLYSEVDNSDNIYEWRAFLENSDNQIGKLLNIEEDVNNILLDKLDIRQQQLEQKLTRQEKKVDIREQEMAEKFFKQEDEFNKREMGLQEKAKKIQREMDLQTDNYFLIKKEKEVQQENTQRLQRFIEETKGETVEEIKWRDEEIQRLNKKNEILREENESEGMISSTTATPREVIREYIRNTKLNANSGRVQDAIEKLGFDKSKLPLPPAKKREFFKEFLSKEIEPTTEFKSTVPVPTMLTSIADEPFSFIDRPQTSSSLLPLALKLGRDASMDSVASMGSIRSKSSADRIRDEIQGEAIFNRKLSRPPPPTQPLGFPLLPRTPRKQTDEELEAQIRKNIEERERTQIPIKEIND